MLAEIVNWAVSTVITFAVVMCLCLLSYMLFQDIVEKGRKR